VRTSIRPRPPSPSNPAASRTFFPMSSSGRPTTLCAADIKSIGAPDLRDTTRPTSCATSTPSCHWAGSRTPSACLRSRLPAGGRAIGDIGPSRLVSAARAGIYWRHAHTWVGAEFATGRSTDAGPGKRLHTRAIRAVPENWWEGEGIRLHELPTAFASQSPGSASEIPGDC